VNVVVDQLPQLDLVRFGREVKFELRQVLGLRLRAQQTVQPVILLRGHDLRPRVGVLQEQKSEDHEHDRHALHSYELRHGVKGVDED